MKNRIVIALLIVVSAATINAFDGYNPDYSHKALQKAKAELASAQKRQRADDRIVCHTSPSGMSIESFMPVGCDEEISDLYAQINDLKRQYQAQLYGIPGYERFLSGKITGPRQTARSAAQGFKGWFARKWYRK